MLSTPQKLFTLSLVDQEFLATVDGDCDAVAGWFKIHVDQNQKISTEPGFASYWQQVVFNVRSRRRKVFKNSKVEFFMKKLLAMQKVDISHNIHGNGVNNMQTQLARDKQVTLPLGVVKLLNCKVWREVSQWVSYYLARDMNCSTILDMSLQPPAMALQVLKFKPDSKLTLSVNTSNTRASRQVLDWVTTVSACNNVNVSSIDCITNLEPGSVYNLVVISPVTQAGRLNTSCILEMDRVVSCLASSSTTPIMRPSSLLLPFRLELWCVVISSKELAQRSHLVSNQPVLGFTIMDQINILAVSHQQEVNYMEMEKEELCTPTMVTTMELANLSLEREELVNSLTMARSGLANGVAYWFVLDYGWNVKLSTLESEAYSQAVFVCKE